MNTKTCARCGIVKSAESFAKNNRTKDGRRSACKACISSDWHLDAEANRAKSRACHAANKETVNARGRAKRARDPEAARAKANAYYEAHKDVICAQNRQSNQRHAARVRAYQQEYRSQHRAELREQARAHWKANSEAIGVKNRARWALNKERYRVAMDVWRASHREQILEYYKQRGKDFRALVGSLKSEPCLDCGNVFPPYVMEFDHVRGEKCAALGKMANYSPEAIAVELTKCELVCCVCHRVRTQHRKGDSEIPKLSAFRLWLHAMKTQPCLDCASIFPGVAMDFDHVRGEKIASISQMWSWGRKRVLEEIAKCELVCANCHRIRTQFRRSEAKAA